MTQIKKWPAALIALAMMATLTQTASAATVPQNGIQSAAAGTHAQDRLLVKEKVGKALDAILAKHGLTLKGKLGNSDWSVVHVPAGTADAIYNALHLDGDIEAVEFDQVLTAMMTPNDPGYGSQWHLKKIEADVAWDITTGTAGRTVAIIDTGVDLNHSDLAGKFVAGYDFVNADTVAMDDQGHGTHLAGIVGAIGNNGNGIAGVDWGARIMPVKVLNSAGSGYSSDMINGVRWAADHGAHVINLAVGGASFSQAFQDAITYAWNKGCVIVAAAGSSVPSYPAAYSNVIAVASTDINDVKSSFSNYGSWVEVAAPGSNILSLKLGGGTTTMSGTSMASAVAAGVVSLAWSKNVAYPNTSVVSRVLNTCDAIAGTGTYWVYGRVNAYRAVSGF